MKRTVIYLEVVHFEKLQSFWLQHVAQKQFQNLDPGNFLLTMVWWWIWTGSLEVVESPSTDNTCAVAEFSVLNSSVRKAWLSNCWKSCKGQALQQLYISGVGNKCLRWLMDFQSSRLLWLRSYWARIVRVSLVQIIGDYYILLLICVVVLCDVRRMNIEYPASELMQPEFRPETLPIYFTP